MEPEFITYKKFNDVALANELAEQLEANGIEYLVEEQSSGFDPSMVMSNAPVDYAVKIKSEEFEPVNQMLKKAEDVNIEDVEKDYYLFSFTDNELVDVIVKADEWSVFDTVLARKILAKRGKPVNDEEISTINKQRLERLRKPEPSQSNWIVTGYAFALLGGVLSFFIGWHLSTYKRTLPDGERVYGYTENDRWHGKIIFYLSFVGLAAALAFKLMPVFLK